MAFSRQTKSTQLSFSLWKDVTYYLKSRQLDKATEAKSFLEQRQREVAKERAERSVKWQTKVRHSFACWSKRTVLISLIPSSISLNRVNKNGRMKINWIDA